MSFTQAELRAILAEVPDPEIPVLSIEELGVLREVRIDGDTIQVWVTPTYSGCPAMDMIEVHIKAALQEHGYSKVHINTVLDPPWTTDWISEAARQKLRAYGIAPPLGKADKKSLRGVDQQIPCPLCGSKHTEMLSLFGSTACKALYRCLDCREPFDYFKCH